MVDGPAALMVDGCWKNINTQQSTINCLFQQSTINNQQSTAFLCFAADPMY
jgi:hypothetical protein